MKRDEPLYIPIPVPMEIPRAHGIWATGSLGKMAYIRMSHPEFKLIQDEAAQLGLSFSSFVRWTAGHTAERLRAMREVDSDEQEHDPPG